MERSNAGNEGRELAAHLRSEISEPVPQGFHFTDHAARQDRALESLAAQLHVHPDRAELEAALSVALREEPDGWTLLKLLELTERLLPLGTADALLELAGRPAADDRARFVAGRACEVLLKLPLDYATRMRANEVSKGPLEDIVRYRHGAARARTLQRPRRVEWAIVVATMVLGLGGLIFALFALR